MVQGVGAIAYGFYIVYTMIKQKFGGGFLITWIYWIIGLLGCVINIFVGLLLKNNGGNAMGEYLFKW